MMPKLKTFYCAYSKISGGVAIEAETRDLAAQKYAKQIGDWTESTLIYVGDVEDDCETEDILVHPIERPCKQGGPHDWTGPLDHKDFFSCVLHERFAEAAFCCKCGVERVRKFGFGGTEQIRYSTLCAADRLEGWEQEAS